MKHLARTIRGAIVALGGAVLMGAIALAAPAVAATVGVSVGNYYFEDSSVGDGQVTARVGDQLRFNVVEGAGHTVTIAALGIDSGQLTSGSTFVTPALTTPGTYSLVCVTHRARNHATTLVVLPGGGTTTTNPPVTSRPTTTITATTVAATTTTATDSPGVVPPGGSTTGGVATSSSAAPAASIADDQQGGDQQGADGGSAGLLPVGVTGGEGTPWLRAVWVALGTLPFFAAAVALAEWSARRRSRTGERPADG